MNNIIVYCEVENQQIKDISFELLTKGRTLADQLGCKLEAVVIGHQLKEIDKKLYPYGVDTVFIADDKRLSPYITQPHTSVLTKLFEVEQPQIVLLGATSIGRDLGPRVSSALNSGLTADCTELEIGEHEDKKNKKVYKNLLYQIRPAFGGNIIANIINPDHRPQIATVREGVMKQEIYDPKYHGQLVQLNTNEYLNDEDFIVKLLDRHIEASKVNIKGAPIIVAGGFGVGSKANFKLLHELANILGGEVAASRAAVDAGFTIHDRQVGQTGVTVRPKLYIACGISGQIQHLSGMMDSNLIISINTDENAPINKIANYVITGKVESVIPKMIKYYKEHTK